MYNREHSITTHHVIQILDSAFEHIVQCLHGGTRIGLESPFNQRCVGVDLANSICHCLQAIHLVDPRVPAIVEEAEDVGAPIAGGKANRQILHEEGK